MLGMVMEKGLTRGIEVGGENILLSHLHFADDTNLFCPPKKKVIRNNRRILDCFGLMFGLVINYKKSFLIPINVVESEVKRLADEMRCPVSKLPVSYLNIPLGANPRRVST
ncbi:hypothetical protein AHAS_Ahas17G0142400 [Arachis hypogaea]